MVYAYSPISASTTVAELNTSTGGAGSPWSPLAKVDCDGTDPAVAGGRSGLGLLETNLAAPSSEVQYRSFSPGHGFSTPVTIQKAEAGVDPTLSQDGTGGIYATWIAAGTGVELAYSSSGGTRWATPLTLLSVPGDQGGIENLTSAVNASGQGWAVYTAGGKEYALEFTKADETS